MGSINLHDTLAVVGVLISWALLGIYVSLLIRRRRRDISLAGFLLGAPLWLMTPRKFFRDQDVGLPWRGLLLWVLISLLIFGMAETIPEWLEAP
jgi:hypothetical protein